MLYYAVLFLIVALAAGFFGFSGTASVLATIAQLLFFVFIASFLAAVVLSLFRRGARPPS